MDREVSIHLIEKKSILIGLDASVVKLDNFIRRHSIDVLNNTDRLAIEHIKNRVELIFEMIRYVERQ